MTEKEFHSIVLMTGNLMKTGVARNAPSSTTDVVLREALNDTFKRVDSHQLSCNNVKVEDICLHPSFCTSFEHPKLKSRENNSNEENLGNPRFRLSGDLVPFHMTASSKSTASLLEEASFSEFQQPSHSPPPLTPCCFSLTSPTTVFIDSKYMEKVVSEERSHLRVSAKLFLPHYLNFAEYGNETCINGIIATNCYPLRSYVRNAVVSLCLYLKTNYLDVLMLSRLLEEEKTPSNFVPDNAEDFDAAKLEFFLNIWPILMELKTEGIIQDICVSDLNLAELSAFCTRIHGKHAAVASGTRHVYTPLENQIYAPDCCDLPMKLIQYGKEHGVAITSHKDPNPILNLEDLSKILEKNRSAMGGIIPPSSYQIAWLFRYSFFIPTRSVMSNLGYIVAIDKK